MLYAHQLFVLQYKFTLNIIYLLGWWYLSEICSEEFTVCVAESAVAPCRDVLASVGL